MMDMSPNARPLSDHELSRIIAFLHEVREPFENLVAGAKPDPYWNVVLALVESHLEKRPIDQSGLIAQSGASYGSGVRLVARMIEEGRIEKVPRGPTHRTSFLRPSQDLLDEFVAYGLRVKAVLAKTFGLRSGADAEEYYFGGSYFASHIISPLSGSDIQAQALRDVRFLLNEDNYFASMRDLWSDFRNDIGRRSSFELAVLPDLYHRAKTAYKAADPTHDVVAINMPWLGRFAERGYLAPLDAEISEAAINPLDFHPSVWTTGRWMGRQYGIPIYCTIEILSARRDLFEAAGLDPPETFAETIAAARALHRPAEGRYGIAWNGARGMPIANSFMLFLASAGSSIIELPRRGLTWIDSVDVRNIRPQIDTEAGLKTVEYMRELASASPPGIAEMDWNGRISAFLTGQVAMTYCWTMRAARFESDVGSRVKRRVHYLPPPVLHRGDATAPVGGFLLTVPARIAPERRRQLVDAIAWMASPEAMKAHVRNGFPVAPRFSVSADPEVMNSSPIVSLVDHLARRNSLHTWGRPAIPQYAEIERLLGEEIHEAVFGDSRPRAGLRRAQARAEILCAAQQTR